ncbi:hypothetical protein BH10PLA1_BH10PLA1_04390 [soil metagenome]
MGEQRNFAGAFLAIAGLLILSTSVAAATRVDPSLVTRFNALLKRLNDDDWRVREQAATEVQKLPVDVLPLVEAALKDRDLPPEVQNRLSEMIGDFRHRGVMSEKTRRREESFKKCRDFVLANYNRVSPRNPKWDAIARDGLVQHLAVAISQGVGQATLNRTTETLNRAVKAGCNDPLVRLYLAIDCNLKAGAALDQFDEVNAITEDMLASSYAPRFKILALRIRADARSRHVAVNLEGPMRELFLADLDAAVALIAQTKGDPEPNEEAPYVRAVELLRIYWNANAANDKRRNDLINQSLLTFPTVLQKCIFAGEMNLARAELMGRNNPDWPRFIEGAKTEADKAVNLDRKSLMAARLKFRCTSDEDADAYLANYKAVIAIDPDDYSAHQLMAKHLVRSGDESAAMAFADECLKSKAWNDRTPLIAFEVILGFGNEMTFDNRSTYFAKPEIWSRISQAYEGILDANPRDASLRSFYTSWACQAGKWDIASAQFATLGDDIDATPFDTTDIADYYRRKADRLGKAPATRPVAR